MKSFLFILLSSLLFHTASFAISQRDLAEAWMNARYVSCGEAFLMQIETRNNATLDSATKGVCVQFDKSNMEKNRECLKALNKNLQIFLDRVPNAAENQGCQTNPQFAEYLAGDTKALKPADPVFSFSTSCSPTDSKAKFKIKTENGKNVCTNNYQCRASFQFGQTVLKKGTYFFRCNDKAKTQADCDSIGIYSGCEGKEVDYAEVKLMGVYTGPAVRVKASKAPAAQ